MTAAALELHGEVSETLDRLKARWFVPEVELTFIMRLPGNPECELVVTRDDLDEVIAVLQRCKGRERRS